MENEERRIKVPTTGVFDFPSLILGGKGKYVDKTDLLYQLANDADQQLFISRPRRFGKSLMLSTLKAMFEGRRDLFKGLAIDKLPWEGWKTPTPVYSFTMTKAVGSTYELFREQLRKLVRRLCEQAGVPYRNEGDISGQFDDFLVAAAAKSPVRPSITASASKCCTKSGTKSSKAIRCSKSTIRTKRNAKPHAKCCSIR